VGYSGGFIKYLRWPKRWTPLMLDFLRSYPLRAGQQASNGGKYNEIHLAH
jgi:hypothetical protein